MYSEVMMLSSNADFLNRCSYAVQKFATYILNEDPGTQNHTARLNWANNALTNPTLQVNAYLPAILQNATVQTQLGAISDTDLQTVVETSCNATIDTPAGYRDYYILATNPAFLQRVQIAVSHFAAYILGEAPNTPNHASRYNWAKSASMSPQGISQAIATAVVLDSNLQPTLGSVTDANLQSAVENQIGLLLL